MFISFYLEKSNNFIYFLILNVINRKFKRVKTDLKPKGNAIHISIFKIILNHILSGKSSVYSRENISGAGVESRVRNIHLKYRVILFPLNHRPKIQNSKKSVLQNDFNLDKKSPNI